MITDTIQEQIFAAMKAKDSLRVSTLKLLSSELHNYQIDHPQMTAEEELSVVRREVKKRRDAIELYERGGAVEKAEKEKKELAILQGFLPQEMGEEELGLLVDSVITELGARGMGDMGKVIGEVVRRSKGMAEGARVAQVVRQKLLP